jgi:hypothetical protein
LLLVEEFVGDGGQSPSHLAGQGAAIWGHRLIRRSVDRFTD